MKIDILTLFPEMFNGPFSDSIVKRAIDEGKVEIKIHNLRDWAADNYKTVDDRPFGGGAGMVMKVDVIDRAVNDLKSQNVNGEDSSASPQNDTNTKVVLLDTKGEFYHQGKAKEFTKIDHLILIVPHYEGVDHRVAEHIADEVVCVGPYVLTGGELPAMIVVDSIVRLLPGVIKKESLSEESFNKIDKDYQIENFDIEYPQYTRPAEYKDWKVPEILLTGHHKRIEEWRKG